MAIKTHKKLVIAFQLMLRLLHGKYIWELRISRMEALSMAIKTCGHFKEMSMLLALKQCYM